MIAKTLQNIANNITFGHKEEHAVWLNDFITANFSACQDYFDQIAVCIALTSLCVCFCVLFPHAAHFFLVHSAVLRLCQRVVLQVFLLAKLKLLTKKNRLITFTNNQRSWPSQRNNR